MENPDFISLTPSQKIHYLMIQSDYNQNLGEFYRSDSEYEAALNLSIEQIRKSRRLFVEKGFLKITSGCRVNNKNLATKYHFVKWAQVPEEEGQQYIQMPRHHFNTLIHWCGENGYELKTFWLYASLFYWWKTHGNNSSFYITKKDIHSLTGIKGIKSIKDSLSELSTYRFSGGDELFIYNERYLHFDFEAMAIAGDPEENENNAKCAESIERAIKEKAKKKTSERNSTDPEKLEELYRSSYFNLYNKSAPTAGYYLREIADQIKKAECKKVVELFFKIDASVLGAKHTPCKFRDWVLQLISKPQKI